MSWDKYINGHIVSSTSLRYIQNLLAATAATQLENSDDSSDDTDAEEWENLDVKAGSMQLVRLTLQGMASRNADEGVKAMGRHAATIRLGRSLWESPALPAEVQRHIRSASSTAAPSRLSKTSRRQSQLRKPRRKIGLPPSKAKHCRPLY